MSELKTNDILFIVGSGISCDKPSGLPAGGELTRFVLSQACGDKEAEAIIKTWQDASEEIKKYDSSLFFPLPRLETILGCVNQIDGIMNRTSILNGLLSYGQIPYNYNHYILSEFLRSGSDILTTNFDLGIENAYSSKSKDFANDIICGISIFKTGHGGKVYHLHGSANDNIERLGATVKRVKDGLDSEAKNLLIRKINNAKEIYVLGYGIVDSFDITPLMESEAISGKRITYIKHKGTDYKDDKKPEFPYYLDRFTRRFKHKNPIVENTTEFLESLAEKYSIHIDERVKCKKDKSNFDWKKEFSDAMCYEYNNDEKLLNYLGIRYQLGFNPQIVSKDRPDIIGEIKSLKRRIDSNDLTNKYINAALRDFDNPAAKHIVVPEKRVEKEVGYIDMPYLIMLRDECDYFLHKYTDCEVEIEKEDTERIDFLFGLLCTYSDYGYDKVRFISYITACLKYKALFSARFMGEDPLSANNKEMLLSLEISHFEGVVTALLHAIESTVICNKIKGNVNKEKLETAINTAQAIAKIIGCNYYRGIINSIICQI